MSEQLKESLADIEALARRVSWDLMDEDQRDEFMRKVVVPRWGKVTSDGTKLYASVWAEMVGATRPTIDARYRRLCRSGSHEGASSSNPTPNQTGSVRSAKSAIRRHPELADELVNDPDVRRAVIRATDEHHRRQAAERSERTERKTTADPTARQIDSTEAINALGAAFERFSREANEALRRVGPLPDGERYWLTGAIDRAEQTVRAARRYLETGMSEIDAELAAIVEGH